MGRQADCAAANACWHRMHGLLWWINIVCLWYGHPTYAASGQTKNNFSIADVKKHRKNASNYTRAAFLEFSIGMVQVSLLTLWVRSKNYMQCLALSSCYSCELNIATANRAYSFIRHLRALTFFST